MKADILVRKNKIFYLTIRNYLHLKMNLHSTIILFLQYNTD